MVHANSIEIDFQEHNFKWLDLLKLIVYVHHSINISIL